MKEEIKKIGKEEGKSEGWRRKLRVRGERLRSIDRFGSIDTQQYCGRLDGALKFIEIV